LAHTHTHAFERAAGYAGRIVEQLGLRGGETVADLGCGIGNFTIPIAERVGNKGIVYAIDSSGAALCELAKNAASGRSTAAEIKAKEADVSNTGIGAGTVDIALFANVLHDINDKRSFLEEVKRILKPGGVAVDIDWNRDAPREFGPPWEIRIGEHEAEKLLRQNGLEPAGKIDAGEWHYGIVLKRAAVA
jgi:ubiquinone/menaquinone biosynthesis C-methylase UbiE